MSVINDKVEDCPTSRFYQFIAWKNTIGCLHLLQSDATYLTMYIVTNEWNLGVWQGLCQILPVFQMSITFFEYPSQLGSEKHMYKNNNPTVLNNQIR